MAGQVGWTVEDRDAALIIVIGMSDNSIDAKARDRLKAFLGQPHEAILDRFLGLLDDMSYYGWAGDHLMRLLDSCWVRCGGDRAAALKRDVTPTKINIDRYGWQRPVLEDF